VGLFDLRKNPTAGGLDGPAMGHLRKIFRALSRWEVVRRRRE
jgi:hypothetical protein